MLRKKIWIPIVCVFVIAMGCGLFYGRKVANEEPIKIYKPVDFQHPVAPKPPPPGETFETGHWHGDEWHANDAHEPAQVATPEGKPGTPVDAQIAQPVNAELQDPANAPSPASPQAPSEESTRTRTPQETAEIQRQWREWQTWHDQFDKLHEEFSQVFDLNTLLLPKTPEEAERYQTDKEWQRKVQEATDKYDEVLGRLQAHEANRVQPPPESFR